MDVIKFLVIPVLNATYYPVTLPPHYMFRPCTAIFRCCFYSAIKKTGNGSGNRRNSTECQRKSYFKNEQEYLNRWCLFFCLLPCIFRLLFIFLSPFVCFFHHFINSLLLSMLPFRNRDCRGCSGPATLFSLIRQMTAVWLYDLTRHPFISITSSDVKHPHAVIISLYWNQRHKRERICFSQYFLWESGQ